MFENLLNKLFDLTKLPTKILFAFSLVSGFLLFVNDDFLREKLFLNQLREGYGAIIAAIFILSSGLVIVNLILWVFKRIQRKIRYKKLKKKFINRVKTMDPFEKSIIREFILGARKSIEMPIDNPSVAGLLDKKILIMNRQFGNTSLMHHGMKTSISINEYVMDILEYKDLDLSNPPTDQEVQNAKINRPEWTDKWY